MIYRSSQKINWSLQKHAFAPCRLRNLILRLSTVCPSLLSQPHFSLLPYLTLFSCHTNLVSRIQTCPVLFSLAQICSSVTGTSNWDTSLYQNSGKEWSSYKYHTLLGLWLLHWVLVCIHRELISFSHSRVTSGLNYPFSTISSGLKITENRNPLQFLIFVCGTVWQVLFSKYSTRKIDWLYIMKERHQLLWWGFHK